jgi:hypothetical protein
MGKVGLTTIIGASLIYHAKDFFLCMKLAQAIRAKHIARFET